MKKLICAIAIMAFCSTVSFGQDSTKVKPANKNPTTVKPMMGGTGKAFYYACPGTCGKTNTQPGNCPKCGKSMTPIRRTQ
jgi:predicted nucleic acid binding AN1-type Zn finger protein